MLFWEDLERSILSPKKSLGTENKPRLHSLRQTLHSNVEHFENGMADKTNFSIKYESALSFGSIF